MSIFKEASKLKLRFETSKGTLSVEQLWDLKLTPLSTVVRNLKKQLTKDNDDELSFLDEAATPVDKTAQLRFEIAKSVYLEKKEERDSVVNEAAKKAHNEKILTLIAKKQETDLESKSVEELEALIQE